MENDKLQRGINERQSELHSVAKILATSAGQQRRWSAISKILIVVLGAVAATSGTAARVAGVNSIFVTVFYAAIGLLIATVGGIEAAFKFGDRGAELTVLAAACQSTLREVDSRWRKEVSPVTGFERVQAEQDLLDIQDQELSDVQTKAAKLGVNITLSVGKLEDPPQYPA